MDKSTAMNLLKNTFIDYTLIDGTTVKLTLAFALLNELENRNPDLASRYYKSSSKSQREMTEKDVITMLYTAYSCANLDNPDAFDEEVFVILLGSDRYALNGIFDRMMGAKKKPASVTHS